MLEGDGFLAATGRLVISGVYMLSRQTFPTKVHPSLQEGARWLLPFTGRQHERDIDSLAAVIATARRSQAPRRVPPGADEDDDSQGSRRRLDLC